MKTRTIEAMRNDQLGLVETPVHSRQAAGPQAQPFATRGIPAQRLKQFIKFCLVGGSGTLVDMGLLFLLADPKMLGWNVALSKLCAAEIALVNNFVWNEVWTFRSPNTISPPDRVRDFRFVSPRLRRLLFFNAICGVGIGFAIALLHAFYTLLGWNLYLSNLLTIGLVTIWNFGMNARFNWRWERTFE